MTVYLDRAKLGISRDDQITLKSSVCSGEEYDSETMAITSPYGGCGTTATVNIPHAYSPLSNKWCAIKWFISF